MFSNENYCEQMWYSKLISSWQLHAKIITQTSWPYVKVTTPCQLKESDKTNEGRISGLHQSMVMSLCAGKLTDGLTLKG